MSRGITTCTKCGGSFDAGSQEAADFPGERLCFSCRAVAQVATAQPAAKNILNAGNPLSQLQSPHPESGEYRRQLAELQGSLKGKAMAEEADAVINRFDFPARYVIRAEVLADLFGGNGLSRNEQVKLVAVKLFGWFAEDRNDFEALRQSNSGPG